MALDLETITALRDAIRRVTLGKSSTGADKSLATCVRVDKDGTKWVRVLGSGIETPVNGTQLAEMSEGDMVEVSIEDGTLSVYGNVTSPSVGLSEIRESEGRTAEQISAIDRRLKASNELVERVNGEVSGIQQEVAQVAQEAESLGDALDNLTDTVIPTLSTKSEVDALGNRVETIEADYATGSELSNYTLTTTYQQGISGLRQEFNSSYESLSEEIDGVSDDVTQVSGDLEDYKTSNNSAISSLQAQVDGQIEAWYYSVDPTLSNPPANGWTTAAEKARHEGDLYYNVQNGHSWRWLKNGSTYAWQQIPDSDAAAALAAAQDAQATADGKRRVFTSTPVAPYDIGDLWVKGSEVRYAQQTRSGDGTQSGSYHESDWVLTATDDSLATAAKQVADGAAQSALSAQQSANDAATLARAAQSAADAVGDDLDDYKGTVATTYKTNASFETDIQGLRSEVSQTYSTKTELTAVSGRVDKSAAGTIQLWFTKANTTKPNKPTSEVTSDSTTGNAWRTVVPTYNASYPNYFYCYQTKLNDGTFTWSDVVLDTATGEAQKAGRDAQSDLNTYKATVQSTYATQTALTQTKSEIELAASETYGTKTEVQSVSNAVDGVSGRVATIESDYTTSASLKVATDAVESRVAQTYATSEALSTTNGNVTAAQNTANAANNKTVAFSGTSSTAAGTAAKVASSTNFALAAGVTVTVRFSNANTTTGAVTLNVNSTGAKTVYVNGAATSSSNQLIWAANANITFTYDGTYWRVDSEPRSWYGTCSVAAGTAAKTATINEVVICKGTSVTLNMTNENTSASATLNVSSTGAKNLYYGTTTTRPTTENGYGWTSASTVSLVFDGAYWRLGDTSALAGLASVKSTVSSHTTAIQQNATDIALKADSSTVYTKTETDGLISTEVSNRNAAIELASDSITSSVASTYTTKTEFNALEIGGRNLLTGTADMLVGDGKWSSGRYRASGNGVVVANVTTSGLPVSGVGGSIRATNNGSSAVNTGFCQDLVPNLVTGETYTQGAWVRASANMDGYFQPIWISSSQYVQGNSSSSVRFKFTTEWQWFSWTNALQGDQNATYSGGYVYGVNCPAGGWIEVCGLKLEHGTKPTDWTPAPEDVETRMTSAETIIEQTANNVLIKATENDTTAAQGGQHLIQSLINVAPSGVTISADKVNIEGAAIFTNGRLSEESLNDRIGEAKDVGVNMMSDVMYEVTSSEYLAFYAFITEPLRANETYTLQLWNVDVSHTGKSASDLGIGVYYCGRFVRLDNDQKLIGTDYFTNGHADHISLTFTFTESWATHSNVTSNHNMPYIRIYNSPGEASGTMSLTIGKWKLEHGSVGTEWSKTGIAYARGGRNLLTSDTFARVGVAGNTESLGPVSLSTIHSNFGTSTNGVYTGFEPGEQYTFRAGFEVVDTSAQTVTTVGPVVSFVYTDDTSDSWRFRYRISGVNYGVLTSDPTKNVSKLILSYSTSGNWTFHEMKLERGGIATEYSFAPEDSLAVSQRIYYRTNVNTSAPSAPTSWVTRYDVVNLAWTTKRPPYDQTYKYLYTCEQRKAVDGTFIGTTDVLLDDTTTIIDGGNIITGTVTANKLNVENINASNSLTIGAMTTATQDAISNDKVEVGGRNLLSGTKDYSTKSSNNQVGISISTDYFSGTKVLVGTWASGNMDMGRFANAFSVELQPDSDYILSFWAKATAAIDVVSYLFTPATVVSGTNSSGNTTTSSDGAITTTLSTEWERYWVTWHMSTAASQATQVIAARANSSASGKTVYVAGVKFEQGNKSTDWTAAPEDTDADIADAAKTATNYIEQDSTGIKIRMTGNTSTYQHQSSTGTKFYVDGAKRSEVGSDGLKVYVGSANSEVSVAEFGQTARIGPSSSSHLNIGSDTITMYGNDGVIEGFSVRQDNSGTDSTVTIGIAGGLNTGVLDGPRLQAYYDQSSATSYTHLQSGSSVSDASAGVSLLTQREWTTDSSKSDEASFEVNVSKGGVSPTASISVSSGSKNSGILLKASESTSNLDINADRLRLNEVNCYMTHGSVGQTVNATKNAVTTYPSSGYVSFGHTYSSAPDVVVGFYSTSSAASFGGLTIAVSEVTTTGFKVKVFNNTSTDRAPGFYWIAMG